MWWTFTRGTAIGSLITSASTDSVALALQDVSYAADASTTSSIPITNGSTTVRNKWLELDYRGLADAVNKYVALQPTLFSNLATDKADLAKLRDLGRKVVVYNGLADDAIPPAGSINYHERVVAAMGGHAEVQKFMRMYLLPGAAHSFAGPRLHGRRPQRRRAAAETSRQRQPDTDARAGSVLHRAGRLGGEGNGPRGDPADVARQQRQLSRLRLSANDDMERQRTGDAGIQLTLVDSSSNIAASSSQTRQTGIHGTDPTKSLKLSSGDVIAFRRPVAPDFHGVDRIISPSAILWIYQLGIRT